MMGFEKSMNDELMKGEWQISARAEIRPFDVELVNSQLLDRVLVLRRKIEYEQTKPDQTATLKLERRGNV